MDILWTILGILGGILSLVVLYMIICLVAALAVDKTKDYDHYSPFYRTLVNIAAALCVWLPRVKVHVTGLEKLNQNRRLLFVCNHRSNFDPILTYHAISQFRLAFISKPENFHIPIYGRLVQRCCFLPIDRENPRNAIRTIQKSAALLEKGEHCVAVYPEGTRSKSGEMLPFHNGVFKIAQKAQTPIVVLTIRGTEAIRKNAPWRTSHVYLDVVDVIPPEEVCASKTDVLGERVKSAMLAKLSEQF